MQLYGDADHVSELLQRFCNPNNVRVALTMLLNIGSVVAIVAINKAIYRTGFKFPSTLMAFHFACTYCFVLAMRKRGVFESKFVHWRVYIMLGMSMAAAVGLVNMSLVHNTVGMYQLLKFLAVITTVTIEYFYKGKTYRFAVYAALVLLVVGVSTSTVSDVKMSATGLAYGLVGAVAVSWYQVYNKAVQTDYAVSALQLLEYEQPCSAFWCLGLALATDDVGSLGGVTWSAPLIGMLLLSGAMAFLVNLSSFLIIGKTSPVTYAVVGHAKTLLLFAAGFTFFGETVSPKQGFGLCIAVGAMVWYTQLTTTAPPKVDANPHTLAMTELKKVSLNVPLAHGISESTRVCAAKMQRAGATTGQIKAFVRSHDLVVKGETGAIFESSIEFPSNLPRLKAIAERPRPPGSKDIAELLAKTVILKLNGGLGTTMGLDKAKSLCEIKNGKSFLDVIAQQVLRRITVAGGDLGFRSPELLGPTPVANR
jgi:solute carrier family 35 protein E3